MARNKPQLPPGVGDILKGLGETIRLARLRRKITTTMLAERAGTNRVTLRSVERGAASVALGVYASVLFCLGLENDLRLIGKEDPLGRKLQDLGLRSPSQRVSKREKT